MKPVFTLINNKNVNLQIRNEYIEELYEKNMYDECFTMINFIVKNRFSYNNNFIYKCLVLITK